MTGAIRLMQFQDLDQILVLENQHQVHPWPRAVFEQALRLKQFCIVYEEEGDLTAYGVADKGHGRTICATTIEGADAIYHGWFSHAREVNAPTIYAEIETDNRAARIRLKRYGFTQTGSIPSFYGAGKAAQFWYRPTPPAPPAALSIAVPATTSQNETVQGFTPSQKSA